MFDKAPEVEQDNIALLVENKRLKIIGKNPALNHWLLIGENYEVLKNLLLIYTRIENGQRVGCIDVIYIDPPYNTERSRLDGNSYKDELVSSKFIYRDKFRRTGWLNMMNERLKLARKLLSPNGVIFISIDDNEQAYLKVLCDEIFEEENFIACLPRTTSTMGKNDEKKIATSHDYVLVYGNVDYLNKDKNAGKDAYNLEDKNGKYHLKNTLDVPGLPYTQTLDFKIMFNNKVFKPIKHKTKKVRWRWSKEKVKWGIENDMIVEKNNRLYTKVYRDLIIKDTPEGFKLCKKSIGGSYKTQLLNNDFGNRNGDKELVSLGIKFNFSKPVSLIKKLIELVPNNKNLTFLDFFAGSGTTGQAVMELNQEDGGNRRFILCTNNENNIAKDICWERLYRVIKGIGSNGQKINWTYSKQVPYLSNNTISTFEIQHYKCGITENCQKLFEKATKELKKLNKNDQFNLSGVSLSRALSSLHPYKCINKDEK